MKATVNKQTIDLHAQPPASGPVGQLHQGDEVEVIDTWHRIRLDGRDTFVRADDLSLAASTGQPAVITPQPGMLADSLAGAVAPSAIIEVVAFSGERFIGDPVSADLEFHNDLKQLDRWAGEEGIRIYITHSFRRRDREPNGAIVPPAKRSNHLVGHAIDMNLQLDSGDWFNSTRLARGKEGSWPSPIKTFINAIRGHDRLRWGGDFSPEDPVHIDDNLYNRNPELWMRKYEAV